MRALVSLAALLIPPGQADDESLGRRVAEMARPMIEDGTCVGLAIGIIDGDAEHTFFFGEVSKGGGEAPDGETLFEIGSITKAFTGILLADVAGRGDVRLDQPVAELLPESVTVPEKDGQPITLVDLSTHTSGLPRLPNNLRPADPSNPYADYSVEQMYEFLSGYKLDREPGAVFSYSNLGVGLLGHALARKAGMTYEELLRERICEPLGMSETIVVLREDQADRFAEGHAAGGAPATHWDIPTLAGAGAIRSTLGDMIRFLRANIDPDSTPIGPAIAASHVVRFEGPEEAIGLGWMVAQGAPSVRWHNGGTGGFHSLAAFDAERRIGVVVLCNSATFDVDRLGFELLRSLRD